MGVRRWPRYRTGLSHAQLARVTALPSARFTAPRVLARKPQSRPASYSWLAFDADGFTATTDRLLDVIAAKDEPDEFDEIAGQTLRGKACPSRAYPGTDRRAAIIADGASSSMATTAR